MAMNGQTVAIKVSWKRSRDSVENECSILQSLEKNHVPNVEQCLGRSNNPYPYEEGRVMIAMTPVISSSGITSSLNNVKTGQPQRTAIKSAVETMVGMLQMHIYTLDVQPLMNVAFRFGPRRVGIGGSISGVPPSMPSNNRY